MKRKKGNADRLTAGVWWSRNRWSCVILAVPLTALITSFILVKDKKPKAPCGSKPEDKKLPKEVQ